MGSPFSFSSGKAAKKLVSILGFMLGLLASGASVAP